MKITPGQIPASLPPTTVNTEARDRAIQAFMGAPEQTPAQAAAAVEPQVPTPAPRVTQRQETPVSNPNQIQPEELTAIAPNPGQNTVVESPAPEETPSQTPEQPSVSSQMQVLARKERALRAKAQQQEQSFKQREAELARREQELATKSQTQQFDPSQYVPKARLKQETLQVLAEEGVNYDELTQQFVEQAQANPRYEALIKRQAEQIDKLTAKIEAQEAAQIQAQDVQYKAAVKQIETDVNNLIRKDPSFEAIRHTRSQKDVVDLIERTFKEEGYVMSVEEACQEVEDYLVDEASKLAGLGKVQKRLAPKPAAQTQTQTQTPPAPQKQAMKTLTNQVSTTRKLSARERAILAFKGEL